MPTQTQEKIFRQFKDLRQHLQAGEIPLYSVPAIWDGGQERHSTPCDIIVTNQRLFGYSFTRFPRERLFLDALPLDAITGISLRQKSFEPLFRELAVRAARRTVYIRAPRQKIEQLYDALRSATGQTGGINTSPGIDLAGAHTTASPQPSTPPPSPIYGRQKIRTSFERSPLATVLLFAGGLILEIGGVLLWLATQSAQTGAPLCIAGFVAVVTAMLNVRQRR
jgi:hypothetical protein